MRFSFQTRRYFGRHNPRLVRPLHRLPRGVIDSKFGCTMQKIKIYFLYFFNIFIFFRIFHIFLIIFSHYLMHWNSAERDSNYGSFILHDLRFQFKFNKKRYLV